MDLDLYLDLSWMWTGFGLDLVWIWPGYGSTFGSGLDLAWICSGSGLVLDLVLDLDMDLAQSWHGSALTPGPRHGSGLDLDLELYPILDLRVIYPDSDALPMDLDSQHSRGGSGLVDLGEHSRLRRPGN